MTRRDQCLYMNVYIHESSHIPCNVWIINNCIKNDLIYVLWQEACNVYSNIVNYHILFMVKKKIKIICFLPKKIDEKKIVTIFNIHQKKWNKWIERHIVASNFHHKPITPQVWEFFYDMLALINVAIFYKLKKNLCCSFFPTIIIEWL